MNNLYSAEIHWEIDGVYDYVRIHGNSIDDLREKARAQVLSRGAQNWWSENIVMPDSEEGK